jgi:hypothetical protein
MMIINRKLADFGSYAAAWILRDPSLWLSRDKHEPLGLPSHSGTVQISKSHTLHYSLLNPSVFTV